jgi:hypothetical protein
MLTYQLRKHVFRVEKGYELTFPNPAEVVFYLQPLQPFGMEAGGGKTAVRAVKAHAVFDANTGRHFIESENPLTPLEVVIEEPRRQVKLQGNELHISIQLCETNQELTELIESVNYGMPILLNIEFADPPVVERIEGKVGETPFRWELADWRAEFQTTTQEQQERKIIDSWLRFDLLSRQGNRRLIAGLHYFHIACRLSRAGQTPWEFMAEIILNLSKTLEVLFPPEGNGRTRDAVRAALTELKYSEEEIERFFLPTMALRNEIDVGHVDLSVYTRHQLDALHTFTEAVEHAFREMLKRLAGNIAMGKFELPLYMDASPRAEALEVIERIQRYFDTDMTTPSKN